MIRLPPERLGHAAPDAIAAARSASAQAIAQRRWRLQRPAAAAVMAGVSVLQVRPASGVAKGRVLHFHGGGFRMGLPEMDAPFAEALADACGVEDLRFKHEGENPTIVTTSSPGGAGADEAAEGAPAAAPAAGEAKPAA